MVLNSTLRYHAFPVRHVRIVSERENARSREFRWKEGLWPWLGGVGSSPGLLAVACQAVDEDNTASVSWAELFKGRVHVLDDGVCGAVEKLDTAREDIRRVWGRGRRL